MGWEVIEETLRLYDGPVNPNTEVIERLWKKRGVWFKINNILYISSGTPSDWIDETETEEK